jgi:hypothetical protein
MRARQSIGGADHQRGAGGCNGAAVLGIRLGNRGHRGQQAFNQERRSAAPPCKLHQTSDAAKVASTHWQTTRATPAP